MKPKKLSTMLLVLSSLFILIFGMGSPVFAAEEYIYVSCMGNLEFFSAHKFGWKWAGEQLGVKTTYVGPAEYDLNAIIIIAARIGILAVITPTNKNKLQV